MNSSNVRSILADFQEKNDIGPTIGRTKVLKQRAQSMLGNRASDDGQLNGMNQMKNHISELHAKFNSPNFGLKPSGNRLLQPQLQQPPTDFERLLGELKQRIASKTSKNYVSSDLNHLYTK